MMATTSPVISPFENVDLIDADGLLVAEERDDDRQSDGGFGRGDRHDEEDEDLPGGISEERGERDEREVDGVEHQLHAHEDDDGVAGAEHPPRRAQRERRAEHGRVPEGYRARSAALLFGAD